MVVAHTAPEAGALAIQSGALRDPVTGKERGTNVMAEFEGAAGPNGAVWLAGARKHSVTTPYDACQHNSTVQGCSIRVPFLSSCTARARSCQA